MQKVHRFKQGESGSIKLPLLYGGVPTLLDGWRLWFTVRRLPDDADSAALFQTSTDAGTITEHDARTALSLVTSANTQQAPARYYFDVRGEAPGLGNVSLEQGVFYIDPAVNSPA